jgi:putative transposase
MIDHESIFFRRNLPHIQPKDSIFFITFRLYGSLPASVITALKEEYESALRLTQTLKEKNGTKIDPATHHRQYFERFDEFLEGYSESPQYLSLPEISQIVVDAINFGNGSRYTTVCYCIMPNHVHLVIDLNGYSTEPYVKRPSYALSRILESLKRHSARQSNIVLQRTGHFWQKESYDHVVRDGNELNNIIRYIIENPVKAGLVSSYDQWLWTYFNKEYFLL